MRQQFTMRYPDVRWSTDEKCQWSGHSRQAQVTDSLIFEKFSRSMIIETRCRATMNKNEEVEIIFMAKINSTEKVTLPLGTWKQFGQENVKEEIYKVFELELKILIEILYKRMIKSD